MADLAKYIITGTSPMTGGVPFAVSHSLGKVQRFVTAVPEFDLGSYAVVFYWTAEDYAAWTDTEVILRCSVDAPVTFRAWLLE